MHQIQDDDPENRSEGLSGTGNGPSRWISKSAYCHVPMHCRHRCFLRFRYKGKVYQFKTLPFGLSTAQKTFTRCTWPILLYCCKLGITLFLYPDDALVLGDTYDQAKTNGRIVAKLLLDLGFVLSLEKCNFEPTQVFTHLGVTWNTKTMMLFATSGEGSSDSETSSTCSEESDVSCCSTSLGADELCEYCLTAHQAAIATATVVAEAALQRSIRHVQNHAYNGGSTPQSRMVALLQGRIPRVFTGFQSKKS